MGLIPGLNSMPWLFLIPATDFDYETPTFVIRAQMVRDFIAVEEPGDAFCDRRT